MKKILAATLLLLSFAGSAFAGTALNTNSPTPPGASIYGGGDATVAAASVNPLGKLSTGVTALVNFTADAATKTSTSYALVTKHTNGSKVFGTANDSTNIYWKASPSKLALTAAEAGTATDNSNFGTGWTSY